MVMDEESLDDTGPGSSLFLEGVQSNDTELNGNQRTSTPVENILFPGEKLSIAGGQLPHQRLVLSPVSDSGASVATVNYDQSSSSPDQTFPSLRESSMQKYSEDESQSLYTSAMSTVNVTVTSGSCNAAEGKIEEGSSQFALHHESVGKSSTQDSTWETAYESFHEDSDLKDVTIRQEHSERNISEEFQDEAIGDSNREDNSGEVPHDLSGSTYEEITSTVEDDQNSQHWRNGIFEGAENSDRTTNAKDMNSPDLDLLNEICEEATNMTIKEALICSLNPGVRAGLREGRLSLNESEILALEQYCEQFIDNLISQLLNGQWSESINVETCKQKPQESKAKVAKKLSSLDLETLKSNCDKFVQSIITESLHDSCFGFQTKETKLTAGERESNALQKQSVLNQDSVQDVLPIFKESNVIQEYIGFLAADIVKSALANLSTSIATKNGDKNEEMKLNNNSTSHDRTSVQEKTCSLKDTVGDQGTNLNDDMLKSHSTFGRGIENGTNGSNALTGSDEDFEVQNDRETVELSDDEQIFGSSLTGALETSLEFDHDVGDWEGGGLLADLHTLGSGKRILVDLKIKS